MLVIGPSLPVVRYLWSFSHSRQPLPGHWHFCLRKSATNPLPLPTWHRGAEHMAASDGSPYHVLYGWGERPGLPPASRHLGRGTGRHMPSTHPAGSLPPRHRRIQSLAVIKQDARLWTIPVVVCTTSAQPHNIDVCYQLGVNSYMVKPMGFERLRYVLELLMRY